MDHEEWSEGQDRIDVAVDGHELEMAYRDDGDGDAVLFLHGIPTWSYLWRDVAPAFTETHRVVVPDLVGYGYSSMHDSFDRSIRAQEQAVLGLLDSLGVDSCSVVAHDIGGGVALRLAANTDRVDKLVLSNAVCYDSWPVDVINQLGLPETTETEMNDFEEQVRSMFELGVYGQEADPEFVDGMTASWLSEEGRTSLSRCAVATNTNHTTEIDYGAIDSELLCLWGADDIFQPFSYAERLAGDVGGEVVALEEAYHWVVEDRTNAYVENLKDFL